jgi:hypothetical protein
MAVIALLYRSGPGTSTLPPPTSSLSQLEAMNLARLASDSRPNTFYTPVYGRSMQPRLYGNSIVIYERVEFKDIRPGDWIIRRTPTGKTLHVCLSISPTTATFIGLNNSRLDAPATADDIIGRYIAHFVYDPSRPFIP